MIGLVDKVLKEIRKVFTNCLNTLNVCITNSKFKKQVGVNSLVISYHRLSFRLLRAADRQRGVLPRAEQNVQAAGAKRLHGMSGHEQGAAVCIEWEGLCTGTMHALPAVKRFATAQASQTTKAIGFCAAET